MRYLVVILLAVLVMVFTIANIPSFEEEKPQSEIYIISLQKVPTFEGADNWVLQYSFDGLVQQAVFQTSVDCEKYVGYLNTKGVIK